MVPSKGPFVHATTRPSPLVKKDTFVENEADGNVVGPFRGLSPSVYVFVDVETSTRIGRDNIVVGHDFVAIYVVAVGRRDVLLA